MKTMNLTRTEAVRFCSRYTKEGDCWLWQGPLDRDGYGSFFLRGVNRRAHRVAWFWYHGEIPKGRVVNHTCRNRSCVNPQHLNCITPTENALRDSASLSYVNSQKTHCPKGHLYDGTEMTRGRTQRVCKQCRREQQRIAKKRRYHEGRSSLNV